MQVNVHEAKSQLSKLIEAALAGEKVTIARAGKPVVDVVVHQPATVTIGLAGWRGLRLPDHVFDGVDDEVNTQFYAERP